MNQESFADVIDYWLIYFMELIINILSINWNNNHNINNDYDNDDNDNL